MDLELRGLAAEVECGLVIGQLRENLVFPSGAG